MNNWEGYQIVNYFINKNHVGNAFTPSQYELVFNHSSLKLFKRRLGMPEEYTPQSKLTRQGYADTTRILMDLEDFVIIHDNPGVVFTNGIANIPQDLEYPIGMTYKLPIEGCDGEFDYRNVELLNSGEFQMRKSSALKPITLEYPVYKFSGDLMYIYPKTIKVCSLTYLKQPDAIVFATTTNATTGELEYDQANSVESEWNDTAKLDILTLVLEAAGIHLRAQDITQTANAVKINGI
jgi:hypothetical protein